MKKVLSLFKWALIYLLLAIGMLLFLAVGLAVDHTAA
jgi:hypothetical protein